MGLFFEILTRIQFQCLASICHVSMEWLMNQNHALLDNWTPAPLTNPILVAQQSFALAVNH
jgi:hypothetical protein